VADNFESLLGPRPIWFETSKTRDFFKAFWLTYFLSLLNYFVFLVDYINGQIQVSCTEMFNVLFLLLLVCVCFSQNLNIDFFFGKNSNFGPSNFFCGGYYAKAK